MLAITRLIIGLLSYSMTSFANAYDLFQVYLLALENDTQYQQEIAQYQGLREQHPQSLGTLLPSINFSANTNYNKQEISGTIEEGGFNEHGYLLKLTQPIFRWDRFVTLKQANDIVEQAYINLLGAQQELMIRVAQNYFEVLRQQDNLTFVLAEKKSLYEQYEQAEQRFKIGLGAITDVQEAKAGVDQSIADEILAKNNVDNAWQALQEIIGELPSTLFVLSKDIPLAIPEPADIDDWVQAADIQNIKNMASFKAVEIARKDIKINSAAHLPTLDLTASSNYNVSGGRFGQARIKTNQIGLEFNIPLYQGGIIISKEREAHAAYNQSFFAFEQSKRETHRMTRQAYLGVVSGISRIHALAQVVISSETALSATLSGFTVGTRTAIDVVAAERQRSSAKRDYAHARYEYLLNTLLLKQAAGTLSANDLQQISLWLQASTVDPTS